MAFAPTRTREYQERLGGGAYNPRVTPAEVERMTRLRAEGFSGARIAACMGRDQNTVRYYLDSAYRSARRAADARWKAEHGAQMQIVAAGYRQRYQVAANTRFLRHQKQRGLCVSCARPLATTIHCELHRQLRNSYNRRYRQCRP